MELFDAGLVLYEVDIALNFWLLALLWRSDRKPYFLAYTAFRLITSLVRLPVLLMGGMDMYSRVYWLTSGILVFASIWILCDFFPKLTIWISLTAIVLSYMQLLHPKIALERDVQVVMFIAAVYILMRNPRNTVAAGLAIATLLPAIGERQRILMDGHIVRFLPTFAFLVAQCIWISGVLKRREEPVPAPGVLETRI